jgi:rhamnogalacturonyl hydrolase YesR
MIVKNGLRTVDYACKSTGEADMNEMCETVSKSLERVEKWVEDHNYKAYEPFDGLSSSFRLFTFGNLFLDRLLMQLIRQSPVNLRPLLLVRALESTKGRGYMASGYLTRYTTTGDSRYKDKAVECLEWLMKNKSPKYKEYSWANHFAFAGRGGRYEKHESIIVWTSLIGQAFLDAYELLHEPRYLDVGKSVCAWISDLPRETTSNGDCISYLASKNTMIHNSNMLGAAMLARTARILNDDAMLRVARSAMEYSCTRQLPDGAWYYAEEPQFHWIDNFHTGYNLNSLKLYIDITGDRTYQEQLRRGIDYYKGTFFEVSGRPKYYNTRTYPVDSQCAAQAIETLAYFSDDDPEALSLACKVAHWTINNMQDKDGHFYYRQYPWGIKAKTPMLHWAQATTYKGLALLLAKIAHRKTI